MKSVLEFSLRVFFRRIEIAGEENIPREGAVIFVLNHPNGLVDPLFVLCLVPRRVSFLAKSTLFKMPVIGALVRMIDALPVYRQQDAGANMTRNRETFAACYERLRAGGSIGLFPEGVSHSDTKLRPLKTGAARIALGARVDSKREIVIVPLGLYYTAKASFRSEVLLYCGAPFSVPRVKLDDDGEPPRTAVAELSERIEQGLHDVTVNAETREGLALVSRAGRIFSIPATDYDKDAVLTREMRLRRRFVEGYGYYRVNAPARLAAIERRIARFEKHAELLNMDDESLTATHSRREVMPRLFGRALLSLLLAPFAFVGAFVHYPAYRLTGWLSELLARKSEDVVSTYKIIGAILLMPLTWAIYTLVIGLNYGWRLGLCALLILPPCGYVAVLWQERYGRFISDARIVLTATTRRRSLERLIAEREAIRSSIVRLGDEAGLSVE
ncbi:MAG: lysophospholipid acyltransferase family protein [Pyrinomonadaceae bacterium MAG19_C2-C3]|nr:lysophospholipid acyltransferase family protein [Pyrinomonadaceae bacterium MAG19_C2-C3]